MLIETILNKKQT